MNNATHEYLKAVASMYGDEISIPGFVLNNGRAFGQRINHPERGIIRECFRNAYMLMIQDESLIYCEGFANGAIVPVLHAWCVNKQGDVIDPTWKPGQGIDYFGIPFKREFVIKFLECRTQWGLIDDGKDFAIVHGRISPAQYMNML